MPAKWLAALFGGISEPILAMANELKTKMARQPQVKDLLNPLHFLSLGFGSGLIKPAPGTWGTLAALPLWWFVLADLSMLVYLSVLVLTFSVGIFLCGYTAKSLGTHDHGSIVWDEFVGVWIALAFFPKTLWALGIGFVLFRLFDILKPYPIKLLDKNVHGGFGIMIDDVLAGVFAWLSLHLLWLALAFLFHII